MLTLHLEAGKFIQMAEIPFWTKMVQYQFRQYHFSALFVGGKRHDNKILKVHIFIVENFCCHCAGS